MICFSCVFSLYFDLFVLIFMLLFYDLLLTKEPDLLATTFIRPGSLKEAGAEPQFFLEQENGVQSKLWAHCWCCHWCSPGCVWWYSSASWRHAYSEDS